MYILCNLPQKSKEKNKTNVIRLFTISNKTLYFCWEIKIVHFSNMYECFLHGIFNYICEFCYLLKFPVSYHSVFLITSELKKKPWTVRYRLDAGRKAAGDIYRLLSRIAQLNVHIFFRFDHISDYGIQKKILKKFTEYLKAKMIEKKKSVDGTGWDVLVKNVSPGYTKLLTICCSLKMKRRPKMADTGWQDF